MSLHQQEPQCGLIHHFPAWVWCIMGSVVFNMGEITVKGEGVRHLVCNYCQYVEIFMIVFCIIYILQIQNISTGFRDMSHAVNLGICRLELWFTCYSYWTFKVWNKAIENQLKFCRAVLQKTKFSGPADDRLDNFSKDALILSSHIALSKFTGA